MLMRMKRKIEDNISAPHSELFVIFLYSWNMRALCYKPEDRGFDSRWCHWNFSLT